VAGAARQGPTRAARRAQYKFHAERVVQLQNVRTAPPAAAFFPPFFFFFGAYGVCPGAVCIEPVKRCSPCRPAVCRLAASVCKHAIASAPAVTHPRQTPRIGSHYLHVHSLDLWM